MSTDKTKQRPQDDTKISLDHPFEVNWWCDWLKCTEAELRAAIAAVGDGVDAVRHYFKRTRGY
jgi:hypothetical protein